MAQRRAPRASLSFETKPATSLGSLAYARSGSATTFKTTVAVPGARRTTARCGVLAPWPTARQRVAKTSLRPHRPCFDSPDGHARLMGLAVAGRDQTGDEGVSVVTRHG